jgi:hypothetical protein
VPMATDKDSNNIIKRRRTVCSYSCKGERERERERGGATQKTESYEERLKKQNIEEP